MILDPCCGSRMFWFDRNNPGVTFGDARTESHTLCDGRALEIKPDIELDFRDLPFDDNTYRLVVFDPPHLLHAGKKSWLALKYGKLGNQWQDDLRAGFRECLRVLHPHGVLIFKWNEVQIPTSTVVALCTVAPLFGHRSGKTNKTHWVTFMKPAP